MQIKAMKIIIINTKITNKKIIKIKTCKTQMNNTKEDGKIMKMIILMGIWMI
jgi:hypothetical protein